MADQNRQQDANRQCVRNQFWNRMCLKSGRRVLGHAIAVKRLFCHYLPFVPSLGVWTRLGQARLLLDLEGLLKKLSQVGQNRRVAGDQGRSRCLRRRVKLGGILSMESNDRQVFCG
jgi:hypothetical protein